MLNSAGVEKALETLGSLLDERGLSYELVTVGGSALLLLGLTIRPTRDLDVVAQLEAGEYVKLSELPEPLRLAVGDVGRILDIGADWINTGPADLLDFGLPDGFAERTSVRSFGPLTLRIASRRDQVFLKLYAAADNGLRSKHFQDLQQLQPTEGELLEGARWAVTHDPSEGFRQQLAAALVALGVSDAP